MKFDPFKHHRRSIRLKGYDYSQAGFYFVTVCSHGGRCLLGEIVDGEMVLGPAGEMVQQGWDELPDRYPYIETDAFIIMPNHIHGIIVIHDTPLVGAGLVPAQERAPTRDAPTIGQIVGAFKSITTNRYISGVHEHGWSPFEKRLWQRNYYEKIIRNERQLNAIRQYTRNNPAAWVKDQLHPDAPANEFNRLWK